MKSGKQKAKQLKVNRDVWAIAVRCRSCRRKERLRIEAARDA